MFGPGSTPILVLSQNTKRDAGKKVQMENIAAGKIVDTSVTASSPLLDCERTLGYLLGLHAHWLAVSTPTQFSEEEAPHWLKAEFLQGGLHITTPPSPFEEKGEARSAGSTPTEPITPQAHVTDLCASAIDLKISVFVV
ncbi:putative HERC2-like protein 3 [Lycorma delicatula]|uniref:putative HERC2-like protein 3 n=1 Tax=Lycorma delicatula TaxID=130591 RepID=UPI003F5199C5